MDRTFIFTSVNKPLEPNVIGNDRLSFYVLLSSLMSSACCLTRLGRLRCWVAPPPGLPPPSPAGAAAAPSCACAWACCRSTTLRAVSMAMILAACWSSVSPSCCVLDRSSSRCAATSLSIEGCTCSPPERISRSIYLHRLHIQNSNWINFFIQLLRLQSKR